MKRAEWPNSQKPSDMLHALLKAKKRGRKFRLFACACCRSVWRLLSDPRSSQGVEVAEAVADGLLSEMQALEAFNAASAVYDETFASGPGSSGTADGRRLSQASLEAAQAVPATLLKYETPQSAQWHASIVSYQTITAATLDEAQLHPEGPIAEYARTSAAARVSTAQADVLRCIFGNPFRRVTVKRAWLTSTAVSLAHAIYDDRAFDRLPILADALEDAGCDNADILNHCRQPGDHVRGCWALDLILAKE